MHLKLAENDGAFDVSRCLKFSGASLEVRVYPEEDAPGDRLRAKEELPSPDLSEGVCQPEIKLPRTAPIIRPTPVRSRQGGSSRIFAVLSSP